MGINNKYTQGVGNMATSSRVCDYLEFRHCAKDFLGLFRLRAGVTLFDIQSAVEASSGSVAASAYSALLYDVDSDAKRLDEVLSQMNTYLSVLHTPMPAAASIYYIGRIHASFCWKPYIFPMILAFYAQTPS